MYFVVLPLLSYVPSLLLIENFAIAARRGQHIDFLKDKVFVYIEDIPNISLLSLCHLIGGDQTALVVNLYHRSTHAQPSPLLTMAIGVIMDGIAITTGGRTINRDRFRDRTRFYHPDRGSSCRQSRAYCDTRCENAPLPGRAR
jgi:hypothetical protein